MCYFQLDSTHGIHPTRLVNFSLLHQQDLTWLNIGSFLLGLNPVCLGLVILKLWCLRLLIIDPLLALVLISVVILAPPTPCSFDPIPLLYQHNRLTSSVDNTGLSFSREPFSLRSFFLGALLS
jgi:hypothetical protein